MKKLIEEIIGLADKHDWVFICHQEKSSMISFSKNFTYSDKAVRMNVYYNSKSTTERYNLTISTSMRHPKQGHTQMFRKNVSRSLFRSLLMNPRLHTKKGYKRK